MSTTDFTAVVAECMGATAVQREIIARILRDDQPGDINRLQREIIKEFGGNDRIDLIYGGATKIKGYVFESARLPEIRGASALLDFAGIDEVRSICGPDRVIYAGGGSFLAFAPAGQGAGLAAQIERRFSDLTQTALSVVVAKTFHLLELRYGRLAFGKDGMVSFWFKEFQTLWASREHRSDLEAYYYKPQEGEDTPATRFYQRKNFAELVTLLATMYNRRRDELASHGVERSLPFVERLPWVERCDSSDHRPAAIFDEIYRALSEASVRKLAIGRLIKHGDEQAVKSLCREINWQPPEGIQQRAWSSRWKQYLAEQGQGSHYAQQAHAHTAEPAFDTHQIGAAGNGFIGLIYADGNNVGRAMATQHTPQAYAEFSERLEQSAQQAVFASLAKHLQPANVADEQGNRDWCHPFEIITIGGDDLLLIVPGDKALEIALSIGVAFERSLANGPRRRECSGRYTGDDHDELLAFTPEIGLSTGLVIAQADAPFFFLQQLVEELLKSAKKAARVGQGGAIDFMVLKSITMVSDKIGEFRRAAFEGLHCRLTARPYTWHEFAGLLSTLRELKKVGTPRSQLYRLREVLLDARDRGPRSSALEYLITRVRQRSEVSDMWHTHIERNWNAGSIPNATPPWMQRAVANPGEPQWETIWTDLVELYDMLDIEEVETPDA